MSTWRKGQEVSVFILENWKFKTHQIGAGVVRTMDANKFLWNPDSKDDIYCLEWSQQKNNRHVFFESNFNSGLWQWIQGGLVQLHPQFSMGWRLDGEYGGNGALLSHGVRLQGEWLWSERWGSYWGVSKRKSNESNLGLLLEDQHFFQLNWNPKRYQKWYYRVLFERDEEWVDAIAVRERRDFYRWVHRFDGQWKVNDHCVIHQRLERAVDSRLSSQSGYAFIEADVHPMSGQFQLIVRYLYFDSQEWDLRRYVQERGVTGSFYMPVLYGTGTRYYFLLKYSMKAWKFQIKWGEFRYDQRSESQRWSENRLGDCKKNLEISFFYEW
jgi:hypothetical protein